MLAQALETRLKVPSFVDCPPVRSFLESKARRSTKTARCYANTLSSFRKFLEPEGYGLESILEPLLNGSIDVYVLLDDYLKTLTCTGQTPAVMMAGVRGYLSFHDVYVNPEKFKARVTMPVARVEEMKALDRSDVRKIVLAITNQRLRAFVLCKASAGFRAVEGLAIQLRDITFLENGARLYMKAAFSKNKLPRETYITAEAAAELKRYLSREGITNPNEFVFDKSGGTPEGMYDGFRVAFQTYLERIGFTDRRRGKRHEITLHSLRAFVFTTIEDITSANYADYILGHKKSTYYRHKEPERQRIYFEKCADALTFLDYEKTENKVKQLEREKVAWQTTTSIEIAEMKKMLREKGLF